MARTVLVVDDDAAILEVIGIVLEAEGYTVAVDLGTHVLQEVERLRPDLLLLDIWMSGVDGRQIAKGLKGQGKTKQLPIILMSAHSNAASAVQETGAEDFLEKPFDLDELVRLVRRYVGRAE